MLCIYVYHFMLH